MSDTTETNAGAVEAAHEQSAPAEAPAAQVAHEPAAPAPVPDSLPASTVVPDNIDQAKRLQAEMIVSLNDWCRHKSTHERRVELISAFFALEQAEHHVLDYPEKFEAAFQAFSSAKA